MDRLPEAVRVAGGVTLLTSIGVVLAGIALTLHLSPTDDALYRAAVGTDLWRWGWLGLPGSIVALKTRRIFPRLAVDWRLPVARDPACDAVEQRMRAWSEVATVRQDFAQGCQRSSRSS